MEVATCLHRIGQATMQEGCLLCYLERLRHDEEASRWTVDWHRRWEWERAVLCPTCSGPRVIALANGAMACGACGSRWSRLVAGVTVR